MKLKLVVLLALCALAAGASVSPSDRVRRAVETESQAPVSEATSAAIGQEIKICAPVTPCGWTFYQTENKIHDLYVSNASYCSCGPGTVCEIVEDNTTVRAFIHKCKTPSSTEHEEISES